MNEPLVIESWKRLLENRPKVDLTNCVPGQKLLTNQGNIVEYVEVIPGSPYSHEIKYSNGAVGHRTNEGWTFKFNPLPGDEDIVYVFPVEKKKRKKN